MKRLTSLNLMLQVITILVALALLTTLGLSAKQAFDRGQAAARASAIVDISHDLFVAMKDFRVERGTVNTALATPEAAEPGFDANLAQRRLQSGRVLEPAISGLGLLDSASTDADVRDILTARAAFAALRSRADAALRLPKGQRPAGLGAEWVSTCDRLVSAIDRLSDALDGEVIRTDPSFAEMMKIKQLVWATRDAAGTDRLRIGEAIANGGTLPSARMFELVDLHGRTAATWQLIEHDAGQAGFPPAVRTAIQSADAIYFGTLGERRAAVIDRLSAHQPVGMSGADWVKLSNPGLEALVTVAYAALDQSKVHAAELLDNAARDMFAASVLLALVTALTMLTIQFLVARVARPMTAITAAVKLVAAGNLTARIPFRRRNDEIGDLARALAVFRSHAVERRRMADELVRSQVAKEAAEAASSVKSQFLANMSHEIRTPLNGVLGMAQVMELGDATPIQREQLGTLREAGESLLLVVNDVLDFAKIEAHKLDLHLAAFDVEGLVGPVAAMFANAAETKGLEIAWRVSEDAKGHWLGDGPRIRQILMNLISNAVKFTDRGRVSLEVDWKDGVLRFTIRDTGIGIAARDLPKLFEKFSQIDDSNTRQFGGTGLGLAIGRRLAKLMGGEIEVESRVGVGSAFCLRLPLPRADKPAVGGVVEAGPGDNGYAAEGRPVRILAAEDNPTNQAVLKALLAPMGVDLMVVENGLEVVDAWRSQSWDLILMDIQMPELSGVAATGRIRAAEIKHGLPAIPIIALSANTMSHQVKDYLAAGMTAHVAKPIDAKTLYLAIQDALTAGRQAEGREVA